MGADNVACLSIAHEIELLPASQAKRYDTTYDDVGFELGFGRAGLYRGHSHRHFVDLLFAPAGIRLGTDSGDVMTLVIAPPKSFLPNVGIADFMFLKFCPDLQDVRLPDKTDEALHDACVLAYVDCARISLPWYPRAHAARRSVTVSLERSELTVQIGDDLALVIGP